MRMHYCTNPQATVRMLSALQMVREEQVIRVKWPITSTCLDQTFS